MRTTRRSLLRGFDAVYARGGASGPGFMLIKFAGARAAQLILGPGKGHFSPPAEVNFNFTELQAPVIKLLRETIGPA